MRYEVTIEQTVTVPMVIEAPSETEALRIATQRLLGALFEQPEALGDPTTEPPRIRAARKLGD